MYISLELTHILINNTLCAIIYTDRGNKNKEKYGLKTKYSSSHDTWRTAKIFQFPQRSPARKTTIPTATKEEESQIDNPPLKGKARRIQVDSNTENTTLGYKHKALSKTNKLNQKH